MSQSHGQIVVQSHVARDFLQNADFFSTVPRVVWEYVSNALDNASDGRPVVVDVRISPEGLVFSDNASGMSREDLQRFFQMHGINVQRERGRVVRGRFGTGKSAAFGIARTLRIETRKDGLYNVVELQRETVERAADGQPFGVQEVVADAPTDAEDGTKVIVGRLFDPVRLEIEKTRSYVERQLGRSRQNHTVLINGHVCEYQEPVSTSEFRFEATPPVAERIGPVRMVVKVSPSPLDDESNGIDVLSHGVWHGTILGDLPRQGSARRLFGEVTCDLLETWEGEGPSPFDNTRNNALNPANPVVATLLGWVSLRLRKVTAELDEGRREHERRKEEGAREWTFARRHPMSKQRDPIQGEFFNSAESIPGIAAALVREATQNSLDAPAGKGAVRVRLYVSGDGAALPPPTAGRYTRGLWPHLEASDPEVVAQAGEPCSFLVVEDFNTTGLTGDPRQLAEPPEGVRNDFFYFFRAEGKSGKSGADRGRWGVGKYVFPMASNINSFFALTVREVDGGAGDRRPLLLGQAVLKNHSVSSDMFEPDGWWAQIWEDTPLPVEDARVIEDFRSTWNVSRDGEPGLSVVVPYVHPDLAARPLKESVVRDYFLAILDNKLVVDIEVDGEERLTIDSSTLQSVVGSLPGPDAHDLLQHIRLTIWGLERPAEEIVEVNASFSGAPWWAQDTVDPETGRVLRERLADDGRVVVRVPVDVTRSDGTKSEESYFDVLLAEEEGHRGYPLFVREGIIVSGVQPSRMAGVRAIVLVRDEPLARMLGDAEGPAHTTWSPRTEKFRKRYTYGPSWLSFIKRAPQELVRVIRGEDEEADPSLAIDFFSIPTAMPGGTGTTVVSPLPPPPPPPPRPNPVRVNRIDRGFSIHLSDDQHGRKVRQVDAHVAYDRRSGNPLTHWRQEDFRLEDMDVEVRGGSIATRNGNRLVVDVDEPASFAIRVRGFDPNRDVFVSPDQETGE